MTALAVQRGARLSRRGLSWSKTAPSTTQGDRWAERRDRGAALNAQSSMQDVAELAGVSVATVSRALRGSSLVNDATRKRVLAAAADLSFSISRAASSLATGKLNRIALL